MTTLRKPAWWQLYTLVPVLGGTFHCGAPRSFVIQLAYESPRGDRLPALSPCLAVAGYQRIRADDRAHASNGDGAPRSLASP
jgi:hypothetical protein